MRLQEARRDLYRRLAKKQGYKSRAAFKLLEACEKYGIIAEGSKVADFGSAPGGWLQVASGLVGPMGKVVGIDLSDVKVREKNVVQIKLDVFDDTASKKVTDALGGQADVVLSDLSPTVTGVWELDQTRQVDLTLRTLELCSAILRRDGDAFFKLFEGERSPEVRAAFRRAFKEVRPMKPAASRSASSELYYYCKAFH